MTTSRSDWPSRAGWLAVRLGIGGPLAAQEITLPSGLSATLYDVVLEETDEVLAPDAGTDPEAAAGPIEPEMAEAGDLGDEPLDQPPEAASTASATWTSGLARFRLVVPGLGLAGATYDAVASDFAWLCEQVALPALDANGWQPSEVVIALSDREVEFGATDAEAVQFFEGFRIADGTCVPQAF
jgi:hypothetical protein